MVQIITLMTTVLLVAVAITSAQEQQVAQPLQASQADLDPADDMNLPPQETLQDQDPALQAAPAEDGENLTRNRRTFGSIYFHKGYGGYHGYHGYYRPRYYGYYGPRYYSHYRPYYYHHW